MEDGNYTPFEDGDDGTLACLNLNEDDEEDGYFTCPATNQSSLVNTTFCIVAYHDNVSTRWTRDEKGEPVKKNKMVIKIKPNWNSPKSEERKFFTGSQQIQKVVRKLKTMGKLPRMVTLRGGGNLYYLE